MKHYLGYFWGPNEEVEDRHRRDRTEHGIGWFMVKLKDRNDLRRGQTEFKVEEDLSSYGGKWVALREGRVIASDLSPKLLRAHREVKDSDVLVPIPQSRGGYFVA